MYMATSNSISICKNNILNCRPVSVDRSRQDIRPPREVCGVLAIPSLQDSPQTRAPAYTNLRPASGHARRHAQERWGQPEVPEGMGFRHARLSPLAGNVVIWRRIVDDYFEHMIRSLNWVVRYKRVNSIATDKCLTLSRSWKRLYRKTDFVQPLSGLFDRWSICIVLLALFVINIYIHVLFLFNFIYFHVKLFIIISFIKC